MHSTYTVGNTFVEMNAEQKKYIKQLKMYFGAELARNYPLYGYAELAPYVADEFIEAVVITIKRINGEPIPLTKDYVLARLTERRKR